MPHEHTDTHPHGEHSHGAAEDYAARKHPEFVALDIGGEIGALIVHTDAELHGVEIEISRTGEDHNRSHKQVLERTMSDHPAFTAVFDGLREGRYTLWVDDQPRAREVEVSGASIAELDWRSGPPAQPR